MFNMKRHQLFEKKSFLAVIPARGGSKRLPRKNVLDLAGKPLISWTINAAKKSRYIDTVVVSTDDHEIANISRGLYCKTVARSSELASDTASSLDVLLDAIDKQDKAYDYAILLQPTSPFRTSHHIDEAIELLFEKSADSVISVCKNEHPPLWSNVLPKNGSMRNFISQNTVGKRGQDLPQYYRLNGAIYIYNIEILKDKKILFSERAHAYIMPQKNSIDIDTDIDFLFADFITKHLSQK